jgi:two-component system alkaline phosphatase synthesis response regulator PhoP
VGRHVLFVDDDVHIGRLIQDLLQQNGYQVTVAKTGKACLEIVRVQPPDLVILDIMMPGMDGFEVCRELRRETTMQQIPVLMLTAMEDPKLNARAFAAGAELCMTKPFRAEKLLSAVHLALQNAARKRSPVEKNAPREA